ncbi:MAG: universal stress protein [Acidimicrobiales bacterium]
MKRLMVGVEGSEGSQAALRWTCALAEATGASVRAISTFASSPKVLPEELETKVAQRRAELEGWVKAVGTSAKVDTTVWAEDPREVLADLAENDGVDLLVVGRDGPRGEPGFLAVGSVGEYLAHHVSVPLAVVPTDASPAFGVVVVGVDGSPGAVAAVDWVQALAGAAGCDVVAATVHEPVLDTAQADGWKAQIETEILEDWARPLVEAGITTRAVAVQGPAPAEGLLETAGEHDADLLVVGMRGRGGFLGLRVGGNAIRALHKASSVALVMVPAAE